METSLAPEVRPAFAADVPAMLRLANWAAEHTPANFATAPEPLEDWARTFADTREQYPWLVAVHLDEVQGFAKASPHRSRGAYRWMAEVTVYVDVRAHGRGVGTALYAAMIPL